ncbi:hypothetical protein Tco_0462288 [Tanacetum coccineum]
MYYPRFTKAITHHFITKDKSILMRNIMFMHTAQDDSILGPMRFVSKSDDFQVHGALLPNRMTNKQMWDSTAYKTYLAYATGAASPKMKRKFKKLDSPSKKRILVTIEKEEPEPAKKVKTSRKAERSKGIDLLSEAALLEEAQVKKVLRRSHHETLIHKAGGSGDGTGSTSGVPDEPKGKSGDSGDEANEQGDDEDVLESDDDLEQDDDERTESDNPRTSDKEEETQDNEYVHTPEDYVPTDDETNDESNDVDEEEYDRIDKELYGDVNVRLIDAEPTKEEKGDKEITDSRHVDAERVNVIQEGAIPKYKTLYALHQRISDLEKDAKELKTVDQSSTLLSTIKYEVPNAIKEYLGTSLDDALYNVLKKYDTDIIKEHSVPAKIVDKLSPKQIALYHALMESILEDEDAMDEGVADKLKKRKPDDADKDKGPFARSDRGLKRQRTSKGTENSKKTSATKESSKGKTPATSSKSSKSNKSTKDQVVELIYIQDSDNVEYDDAELNYADMPMDQGVYLGNTNEQPDDVAVPKNDWYKKSRSDPSPDPKWNKGKFVDDGPEQTSTTKSKAARYELKGIEDMVPNLWIPVKVVYGRYALMGISYWQTKCDFKRLRLNDIEDMLLLIVQKKVDNLDTNVVVHLAVNLRMFARRMVIQARVEDLQLGVESYQKKLNLTKPRTRDVDMFRRPAYTTLLNPQGVIYEDNLKRKRFMLADKLHNLSDDTLISVRDTLSQML